MSVARIIHLSVGFYETNETLLVQQYYIRLTSNTVRNVEGYYLNTGLCRRIRKTNLEIFS